tara:strand:+ start:81 stop:1295 length:1215 start_codon:yes stop_codon:yes gene_type:complete
MRSVLYSGAFKPPHRGHFEVVKRLLNNNHGGHPYDIDSHKEAGASALSGIETKADQIDKVYIFIGGGERNGLTKEESMAVWNIYAKYLPGVEILDGQKNPVFAAKDYAKEHPDQQFYAVTGIRGEEDFVDLRRVTAFKSRENVDGLVIAANADNKVRATDFRNAILSGNLDLIIDFFPSELEREEILKIVNMLKQSIISEMMGDDLNKLMDSWFINEKVDESASGSPTAPQSVTRSDDRAKLVKIYDKLSQQLEGDEYNVTFQNDHVRVAIKGQADKHNFDFTPYMGSILEYMLDEGMKITPLPEVKIKRDLVEAADFFGKTAYYDPTLNEIVIYTEGRHPKDVMRSFTHEMIHHIQNLEGRLSEVNTSDTNADDNLLELEKEAYLNGNITFRNWEDKVKRENK